MGIRLNETVPIQEQPRRLWFRSRNTSEAENGSAKPRFKRGTLALSRIPGENVGSYLITPSGLISSNYTLCFNRHAHDYQGCFVRNG